MTYYVLYRSDEKTEPAGIFVVDAVGGHAMVWDHRRMAWSYNPGLAARFLDDHRNFDRYEEVDRETIEKIAIDVTGGSRLPDDDAIRSMFGEQGTSSGERE